MFARLGGRLRRLLAQRTTNRIPRLYSTVDKPVEVPVQVNAYELAVREYVQLGDHVLDVGFGLGYGLRIMSRKAERLVGIEVDKRAVARAKARLRDLSTGVELRPYKRNRIPYEDKAFDVVTCIDVIEHVPDYLRLMMEMVRVSRRVVFLSTPRRRAANTRPDGKPTNYWHLREWSHEDLHDILLQIPGVRIEWRFLDGPWEGPFAVCSGVSEDTQALVPVLLLDLARENRG